MSERTNSCPVIGCCIESPHSHGMSTGGNDGATNSVLTLGEYCRAKDARIAELDAQLAHLVESAERAESQLATVVATSDKMIAVLEAECAELEARLADVTITAHQQKMWMGAKIEAAEKERDEVRAEVGRLMEALERIGRPPAIIDGRCRRCGQQMIDCTPDAGCPRAIARAALAGTAQHWSAGLPAGLRDPYAAIDRVIERERVSKCACGPGEKCGACSPGIQGCGTEEPK